MTPLALGDFFVVRTPRFPIESLLELPTEPVELEERLAEWLALPIVQEAIYLASGSFHSQLGSWQKLPYGPARDKFISTILKYFNRMSSRATPFGLFAGIAFGRYASQTALACGPESDDSRVTRIDMSVLCAAQSQVSDEIPGVRLSYQPNATLHQVNDTLHYIEPYFSGGERQYRLSSVAADPHLLRILEHAVAGRPKSEMIADFRGWYPEADELEVQSYFDQLIDASVLQKQVPLKLTGDAPERQLARSMKSIGANQLYDSLRACRAAMHELDQRGTAEVGAYQQARACLDWLPSGDGTSNVFQVDLRRSMAHCEVDPSEFQPLLRALSFLLKDDPPNAHSMTEFAARFNASFENQMVPLLQLLNEEVGLPFGSANAYQSKLLAGLKLGAASGGNAENNTSGKTLRHELIRRVSRNNAHRDGILRIRSTDPCFANLSAGLSDAPYSFAAVVSLYRDDSDQLLIHFRTCSGPSAAKLIGRFCHLDGELLSAVKRHLEGEEKRSEGVIFAEVLHIPHGRGGNVIARPHLRDYEIVFLADSDLPSGRQISVSDLHVSVESGVVKLYSKRLNRRVIPRLSCAHNYNDRSLGIYRFLCALGGQGSRLPKFELPSEVSSARFIPRIMLDNVILQEKQWVVSRLELEELTGAEESRSKAWDRMSSQYRLDRFVVRAVYDNTLVIDLRSVPSVKMLLREVRGADEVVLRECLSAVLRPAVRRAGQEQGVHFANDVIVPIINASANVDSPLRFQSEQSGLDDTPRVLAPGSGCLSLKFYGSPASIEEFFLGAIVPLVRAAQESGEIRSWFFVRYGDPDWHIRLRLFGEPAKLGGVLLPSIERVARRPLEVGLLKKVESFTYVRETERYGGAAAILLAESMFCAESEMVAAVLGGTESGSDDLRWKFALLASLELLRGFDLGIDTTLDIVSALRKTMGSEFNESSDMRVEIGKKYRTLGVKKLIDGGVEGSAGHDEPRETLLQYSAMAREHARQFHGLRSDGKLIRPLPDIVASLLHMLCNRIFRFDNRRHELVICDFLRRYLLGERERNRQRPTNWALPT